MTARKWLLFVQNGVFPFYYFFFNIHFFMYVDCLMFTCLGSYLTLRKFFSENGIALLGPKRVKKKTQNQLNCFRVS